MFSIRLSELVGRISQSVLNWMRQFCQTVSCLWSNWLCSGWITSLVMSCPALLVRQIYGLADPAEHFWQMGNSLGLLRKRYWNRHATLRGGVCCMTESNNGCEGRYTALTWVRFQNYRSLIRPCKNRREIKIWDLGSCHSSLLLFFFLCSRTILYAGETFLLFMLNYWPLPFGAFQGQCR